MSCQLCVTYTRGATQTSPTPGLPEPTLHALEGILQGARRAAAVGNGRAAAPGAAGHTRLQGKGGQPREG
eukprot:359687-Chlamydomonas_euryale.AAC.2